MIKTDYPGMQHILKQHSVARGIAYVPICYIQRFFITQQIGGMSVILQARNVRNPLKSKQPCAFTKHINAGDKKACRRKHTANDSRISDIRLYFYKLIIESCPRKTEEYYIGFRNNIPGFIRDLIKLSNKYLSGRSITVISSPHFSGRRVRILTRYPPEAAIPAITEPSPPPPQIHIVFSSIIFLKF